MPKPPDNAPTRDEFNALGQRVVGSERKIAADEVKIAATAVKAAADEASITDAQTRLGADDGKLADVSARVAALEAGSAQSAVALSFLGGAALTATEPLDDLLAQAEITDASTADTLDIRIKVPMTSTFTRRLALAGLLSTVSYAALARPAALHGGHGHGGVTPPPPPPPDTSDLLPNSIVLGATTLVPDASLHVAWNILNQGAAAANAASTTAVRINQTPLSSVGTDLASIATSALAASASEGQSADVTVPHDPGTYYLWIVADSTGAVTNQSTTSNDAQRISFNISASPGAALAVAIAFADGKSLSFNQASATDVGSYVSSVGGFTQQRLRQRATGHGDYRDGFVVYFCPDVGGGRDEVIFEYGTEIDFSGTSPVPARGISAADVPVAYTATITGGNIPTSHVQSVPYHRYGTRWRYQQAVRPFVRTYTDLAITLKAILQMDPALAYGVDIPPLVTYDGPMSLAGQRDDWSGTGDAATIGFMNEYEARYLNLGEPGMASSMRAVAEAIGSAPFWARDVADGCIVNPYTRHFVALLDATGTKTIPQAPLPTGGGSYFYPEANHTYSMSFVPWLLTDDPYFLEGAQMKAIWGVLWGNYRKLNEPPPVMYGLSNTAQTRGWAWSIRDAAQMAGYTPATAPSVAGQSWILPRSVFTSIMADNREYARRYLDATCRQCTVFKMMTEVNFLSPFMVDYLTIVQSWMKYSGLFSEWDAVFEYVKTPRMALSDVGNAYGWDKRYPMPYNSPVEDANLGAGAFVGSYNGNYSSPTGANTPSSWAQLWADDQLYYGINPATFPADGLSDNQHSYFPWIRATLGSLSQGGAIGAKANHDWFKPRMEAFVGLPHGHKWSMKAV